MTEKLSSPELQTLRAKAARGVSLSIEEVARFVAATRKGFSALMKKDKPVKKEKATPTPESEIDFF